MTLIAPPQPGEVTPVDVMMRPRSNHLAKWAHVGGRAAADNRWRSRCQRAARAKPAPSAAEVDALVAAFHARGGVVTQCPPGTAEW